MTVIVMKEPDIFTLKINHMPKLRDQNEYIRDKGEATIAGVKTT